MNPSKIVFIGILLLGLTVWTIGYTIHLNPANSASRKVITASTTLFSLNTNDHTYTPHSPILNTSNKDFLLQGFLGDDPYRLERVNITASSGIKYPKYNDPSIIFQDNYDYAAIDSLYIHVGPGWSIFDNQLIAQWMNNNWTSCRANLSFPLQEVTIEFDYNVFEMDPDSAISFQLTNYPIGDGGRFIDFFGNGSVWYTTTVGEPGYRPDSSMINNLPVNGKITIVINMDKFYEVFIDDVLVADFYAQVQDAGTIGFGVFKAYVAFDNLLIRKGMYYPKDADTEPTISSTPGFEFLLCFAVFLIVLLRKKRDFLRIH